MARIGVSSLRHPARQSSAAGVVWRQGLSRLSRSAHLAYAQRTWARALRHALAEAHRRYQSLRGLKQMCRKARRPARGFTLLEVLVALAILAIALGALLPIFSGVLRGEPAVDGERLALSCARAKLASLGTETPLIDGVTEGVSHDGFKWRLEIIPDGADEPGSFLAAKLVTLTLTWSSGQHVRSLTVKTVRAVAHG